MRFILKAMFFLAVVAAFIPRDPGSNDLVVQAPKIDPQNAANSLCEQQQAFCATAQESADAAKLFAGFALKQAQHIISEYEFEPASDEAEHLEDVSL